MFKKTSVAKSCWVSLLLIGGSLALNAQVVTASPCPAGWTYEVDNGTCFRAFTESDTWTPPAGVTSISYLVVGGGGGGAQGGASRPGGAGGQVLTESNVSVNGSAITITVGTGGAPANTGGASRLQWTGTTITANGGAAGGGPSGANGPSNSFSGTAVIYGSAGGAGGGQAGGSGAGRGADNYGGCGGGLGGDPNRGGGGGGGGVCNFGFGDTPTTAGSGGSGVVMIRYVGFGVSSFSTSTGAFSNSSSLSYSLSFSATIDASTLTAADFSNSGTATGCVFSVSPSSGTASSFTVSVTGCSDGTVAPTLASGSITTSAGASGPGASSTANSVTLDTTPPSAPSGVDLAVASDTGASDSDNNTNDTTPTLSASGGTNGDTMTISATNGTTTVSCTYVIGSATNCTLPTLTDGTWNISSTLTDPAGNTSTSSSALPIAIDGTAPLAPAGLDLLATSDSGSSDSDNFTGDNTPTLSASGGTNGDTMTISATNGTTTVSCTYVIGSATNCTLPTLTDGTWNISATLTDPLGNESAASSALPVTIATSSPSRSAPDLLATSDNGASNSDNITNDSTPEISIAGALAGDVVTVSATNGTATLTCTYTVGAATSCSLPTLSDGTWTVSASVTDAAGNTGPATGSLPITIDATAPSNPVAPDLATTSDNGGSQTDNVTTDTTPTFGMAGANDGDTITFTASDGKGNIRTCSYVHSTTVSSCEILTLSAGTWTVEAIVVDTAGNQSAKSPPTTLVIGSQPASSPLPTTGFKLPVDLIALWMLTFGIGLTVLHRSRKRLQIGN